MRPNVLFITVDQWRGDTLSCVDHPVVRTPHLDGLAAEGTLFRRHYAQCAPCGPSRASLLTGMYLMNHRSGLNGTPLDAGFTNLALEARAAGYDPVLFGYTDTSIDPRTVIPTDDQLRSYEGSLPGFSEGLHLVEDKAPWLEWLGRFGHVIPDRPDDIYRPDPDFDASGRGSTWAPTVFPAEHSISAFLTNAVIDYLDSASVGWFVHASYIRPHPPFRAPPEYHDRYDPAEVTIPARHVDPQVEADQHPFLASALALDFVRAPDDETEQRQWQATYYGMMNEVDDQLGRLFDHLRAGDQWDDTLVIVTADHGEELGGHWLSGKLGWYDGSYHVPLIVRDPRAVADATRGRRRDEFTENVDVLPTILDWLGTGEPPLQCDGRSLLPLIADDPPADWRTAAHWEFDFRIPQITPHPLGMRMDQAVLCVERSASDKYVHFPTLPALYYDLVDDPGELHDRAGEPASSAVVLEAAQRMLSWRIEHAERAMGGQLLTPDGVFTARDWPR